MLAPVGGTKRRKLLVLIAAYADAGEPSPPMRQLSDRLGLPAKVIDRLLDRLEQDGWLTVEWAGNSNAPAGARWDGGHRRNRYVLRNGDTA
jgi:DNA-binding Lrp family transcriptional regulator